MAERKFLSSVESLGLSDAPAQQAAPRQAPRGGNPAALLRYGNRILQALKDAGGTLPVTELLVSLQNELGAGFNVTEAFAALQELQAASALTNDGRTCTVTPLGLSMLA
jgi:hypothetical protein